MRILFGVLVAFCTLWSSSQAATLSVTLADISSGQTPRTTLTLNFGNSIDNAGFFTGADFVSSLFQNISSLGPQNLIDIVGTYPASNFDGTDKAVTGSINADGSFNFGFKYVETNAGLGFAPATLNFSTGNILRGPIMWTAIDGAFLNFAVDTVFYNATGTALDFSVTSVPLPFSAALLVSALGALGFARRYGDTRRPLAQ